MAFVLSEGLSFNALQETLRYRNLKLKFKNNFLYESGKQ